MTAPETEAEPDLQDLPAPGTVLGGKYAIVRVLGRGGMGVVLEARHLRLGQNVALKLLLPSVRAISEITARFEREGRAAARLQGPHVARILDVDTLPDGSPFMVMELLRGRELGEELTANGPLPVRDAVGYILQACAGMAEAHRMGIVHRDLKPSNLFLCDLDGHRIVKVLDFGISKLAGDIQASVTTTASAFGTPLYMSPEQVRSVRDVDARTDIWSLGVVLYELLAGASPFERTSATAILAAIVVDKPVPIGKRRSDLPSALAAAVMKALEKDPNDRFADVRELAAAIAPYGPGRDDPAQAAVLAGLLGVPGASRPRKRLVIAGVVALAAALAGAAIFVATSSRPPVSIDAASDAPPRAPGAATARAPTETPAEPVPVAAPSLDPVRPVPTAPPSAPSAPHRKLLPGPGPTAAPGRPPDDPKYL